MRWPRRSVFGVSDYDPALPVGGQSAMAMADKEWWNGNLHKPAMLNLTRPPQLKTVLLILPWSVAVEQGLGKAHATHASVHGSPQAHLDWCNPAREGHFL